MRYIDDDGFTAKVLARLPPPRRAAPGRFAISLATVIAVGAACFALRDELNALLAPTLAPVPSSLSAIAAAGVAVGILVLVALTQLEER